MLDKIRHFFILTIMSLCVNVLIVLIGVFRFFDNPLTEGKMRCLFGENSGNSAVLNLLVLPSEDNDDCLEIIFSLGNSQFICQKKAIVTAMANVRIPRIVTMSPEFFDALGQYNEHLLRVMKLLSDIVHYVDVRGDDAPPHGNFVVWGIKEPKENALYHRYWFVVNDSFNLLSKPKYFLYDPLVQRVDKAEELDNWLEGILKDGGTCRGIKRISDEQKQTLLKYFSLRNIVYKYLKDLAGQVIRGDVP